MGRAFREIKLPKHILQAQDIYIYIFSPYSHIYIYIGIHIYIYSHIYISLVYQRVLDDLELSAGKMSRRI